MDNKEIFFTVLKIILLFTFMDLLVHTYSVAQDIQHLNYTVPNYYFINKVIFGVIIGFFALFVLKNKSALTQALWFSAIVSILLQVRYYGQGYPTDFIVYYTLVHFIILFFVSLYFFKKRSDT